MSDQNKQSSDSVAQAMLLTTNLSQSGQQNQTNPETVQVQNVSEEDKKKPSQSELKPESASEPQNGQFELESNYAGSKEDYEYLDIDFEQVRRSMSRVSSQIVPPKEVDENKERIKDTNNLCVISQDSGKKPFEIEPIQEEVQLQVKEPVSPQFGKKSKELIEQETPTLRTQNLPEKLVSAQHVQRSDENKYLTINLDEDQNKENIDPEEGQTANDPSIINRNQDKQLMQIEQPKPALTQSQQGKNSFIQQTENKNDKEISVISLSDSSVMMEIQSEADHKKEMQKAHQGQQDKNLVVNRIEEEQQPGQMSFTFNNWSLTNTQQQRSAKEPIDQEREKDFKQPIELSEASASVDLERNTSGGIQPQRQEQSRAIQQEQSPQNLESKKAVQNQQKQAQPKPVNSQISLTLVQSQQNEQNKLAKTVQIEQLTSKPVQESVQAASIFDLAIKKKAPQAQVINQDEISNQSDDELPVPKLRDTVFKNDKQSQEDRNNENVNQKQGKNNSISRSVIQARLMQQQSRVQQSSSQLQQQKQSIRKVSAREIRWELMKAYPDAAVQIQRATDQDLCILYNEGIIGRSIAYNKNRSGGNKENEDKRIRQEDEEEEQGENDGENQRSQKPTISEKEKEYAVTKAKKQPTIAERLGLKMPVANQQSAHSAQQSSSSSSVNATELKQNLTVQELDTLVQDLCRESPEYKDQIRQFSKQQLLDMYRSGVMSELAASRDKPSSKDKANKPGKQSEREDQANKESVIASQLAAARIKTKKKEVVIDLSEENDENQNDDVQQNNSNLNYDATSSGKDSQENPHDSRINNYQTHTQPRLVHFYYKHQLQQALRRTANYKRWTRPSKSNTFYSISVQHFRQFLQAHSPTPDRDLTRLITSTSPALEKQLAWVYFRVLRALKIKQAGFECGCQSDKAKAQSINKNRKSTQALCPDGLTRCEQAARQDGTADMKLWYPIHKKGVRNADYNYREQKIGFVDITFENLNSNFKAEKRARIMELRRRKLEKYPGSLPSYEQEGKNFNSMSNGNANGSSETSKMQELLPNAHSLNYLANQSISANSSTESLKRRRYMIMIEQDVPTLLRREQLLMEQEQMFDQKRKLYKPNDSPNQTSQEAYAPQQKQTSSRQFFYDSSLLQSCKNCQAHANKQKIVVRDMLAKILKGDGLSSFEPQSSAKSIKPMISNTQTWLSQQPIMEESKEAFLTQQPEQGKTIIEE